MNCLLFNFPILYSFFIFVGGTIVGNDRDSNMRLYTEKLLYKIQHMITKITIVIRLLIFNPIPFVGAR